MEVDDKKFKAVTDLLIESWRLNQFTKKLAARLADEKVQRKALNQVTRFDKHFQAVTAEFGLEVLDFTGAEFETGLPISPINLADFTADENLFVEAMLEPTIKIAGSAEIVKIGAAVLGGRGR